MDIEALRTYCLSLPGTHEECPFGPTALVFKVGGKIYALLDLDSGSTITLKCDPERAQALREAYPTHVMPGYHMNKRHWNTLHFGAFAQAWVTGLVLHAYTLVLQSLPKKAQAELRPPQPPSE